MGSTSPLRIDKDDCALMVVDIQDRLLPAIHEHERLIAQSARLIQGARLLGVPIVWTEQYRQGLGPSNAAIIEAIGEAASPLEKMTFGCLDDDGVRAEVERLARPTLILCGIEAHICVAQTALRGLEMGHRVAVAEDAVSSRRAADREVGLARMRQAGAIPANVEMLLMEWMRVAGTETFRRMLPLLKG